MDADARLGPNPVEPGPRLEGHGVGPHLHAVPFTGTRLGTDEEDGADVGDSGHDRTGQGLQLRSRVQRRVHLGRGAREQLEPNPILAGDVLHPLDVGDVLGDGTHTAPAAVGGVDRDVAHPPDARPSGSELALEARPEYGLTGLQDPAQGPIHLRRHVRVHLIDGPTTALVDGAAVHGQQGVVHAGVPQVRVEDHEPDRKATEQRIEGDERPGIDRAHGDGGVGVGGRLGAHGRRAARARAGPVVVTTACSTAPHPPHLLAPGVRRRADTLPLTP